jgi:hypothetical protein
MRRKTTNEEFRVLSDWLRDQPQPITMTIAKLQTAMSGVLGRPVPKSSFANLLKDPKVTVMDPRGANFSNGSDRIKRVVIVIETILADLHKHLGYIPAESVAVELRSLANGKRGE